MGTAVLGSELETTISEDVGFKQLGLKRILPAYEGKLPFSSLYNITISNLHKKFAASANNKVIYGDLQKLREFIVSKDETEFVADKEWDIENVIRVQFTENELYIISQDGSYQRFKIMDIENGVSSGKLDVVTISDIKFQRNHLYYLDETKALKFLCGGDNKPESIQEGVVAFDISEDFISVLTESKTIRILKRSSLEETKIIDIPEVLLDDLEEQVPTSINILSGNEYLVVFANVVDPEEEEPMHDHKMYIVTATESEISYRESFDIAPAFSSVSRSSCYYNVRMHNLLEAGLDLNIIGSATSSELSIWDSKEVLQPAQDSDRAVFPISKETDQDTTPIGIALDVCSQGDIEQPCSGVDKTESLPLLYSLTNEGFLQISGFFHATLIKEGKFAITAIREQVKELEKDSTMVIDTQKSSDAQDIKPEEDVKKIEGNRSSFMDLSKNDNLPTFSQMKLSENQSAKMETTQQPVFGSSKPSFGAPSFGAHSFGSSSSGQNTFGAPSFGSSSLSSGSSAFGASSFGKSAFGDSSSNKDQENTTNQSNLTFGKPAFGSLNLNKESSTEPQSSFGKPAFGSLNLNKESSTEPQSSFGKPAFGSLNLNKESSNEPQSSFGKPAFGSLNLNKESSTEPQSSFGKPAFGGFNLKNSTGTTDLSTDKPAFGQASFSFNQSSSENTDKKDSEAKNVSAFKQPFKFHNSPFATSSGDKSPFANLLNKEEGKKSTSNDSIGNPFLSKDTNDNFGTASDKKQHSSESDQEQSDSNDESLKFEEKELPEVPSTSNISDLFDSTVEQTPFKPLTPKVEAGSEKKPDTTISSLTERIKQSAQLSENELSAPKFPNIKADNDANTKSPFSAFANKINQPATTSSTFTFNKNLINESSNGHNKDGDKEAANDVLVGNSNDEKNLVQESRPLEDEQIKTMEETKEQSSSKDHLEKGIVDDEESDKDERKEIDREFEDEHESDVLKNETTPEEEISESVNNSLTFESSKDEHNEEYDDHDVEGDDGNEVVENEIDSDKVALDGGNEDAGDTKHADEETSHQKDRATSTTETTHSSIPVSQEGVDASIQAVTECSDGSMATDEIEYCDFEVQTFEKDELYLSAQHKPEPIPEFLASADTNGEVYSSDDKVMKLMERTVQVVSAEIEVLFMNIDNLDKAFKDQSTLPFEKTSVSFIVPQTWRLGEMEDFSTIVEDELDIYNDLFSDISDLKNSLSSLNNMTSDMIERKDDLVSDINYVENSKSKKASVAIPLTRSQLTLRQSTRDKMGSAVDKLERIQDTLNTIKIVIERTQGMSIEPLLRDLTKKYYSHIDLLALMKNMRNQLSELQLEDVVTENAGLQYEGSDEINSIDIANVSLELDTKKQIGQYFKNLKH